MQSITIQIYILNGYASHAVLEHLYIYKYTAASLFYLPFFGIKLYQKYFMVLKGHLD